MTPDERRERAEQVAGSHYECEDCWYSCPLSDGGCCDDRQPKECNCGRDERIKRIMHELRDAEARGWERAAALVSAMPMAPSHNVAVSLKLVAQRLREGKP